MRKLPSHICFHKGYPHQLAIPNMFRVFICNGDQPEPLLELPGLHSKEAYTAFVKLAKPRDGIELF